MMTIKEMRTLLGISQAGFAKMYGMSTRAVERWEAGERKCPDYVLALLERAVKQDAKEMEQLKAAAEISGTASGCIDEIINHRFL